MVKMRAIILTGAVAFQHGLKQENVASSLGLDFARQVQWRNLVNIAVNFGVSETIGNILHS
jgi:hypothetical protein